MSIEGKIIVDIERRAGVRVSSTRPRDLAQVFAGKTPDEVVTTVPLLFSVCGGAQAAVAASACEQAISADDEDIPRRRARELIVLAENAREHCLRILMDWQLGDKKELEPEPLRQVMALKDRMQVATFGQNAPFQLFSQPSVDGAAVEAVAVSLEAIVEQVVLGEKLDAWLARSDLRSFEVWLAEGRGVAARFLAGISQRSWSSMGRAETQFLPKIDSAAMWDALHSDRDGDFTAQPEWKNRPCETSALARFSTHPLISALMSAYGSGLLTRHAARLVELAQIPTAIRNLQASTEPVVRASRHADGGLAEVETARGRLIHAIRMDGGHVLSYKILAPTEWNFHPRGAAARALEGLAAGDDAETKVLAEQVIRAIDPCVGFEVRVH
jgi:uptake hydrogenase large subunit